MDGMVDVWRAKWAYKEICGRILVLLIRVEPIVVIYAGCLKFFAYMIAFFLVDKRQRTTQKAKAEVNYTTQR